jgi:hypothetical protein
LTAVQQNSEVLEFASDELKKDKLFLIECYRINENTIEYSDFIEQFDELENGQFDDTFIEENVDILDLVKNKKELCKYLLDNEQYKIIYNNEEISEYIKNNNNILIQDLNDLNIEKEYDDDKLREQFRNNNKSYNVIFIN